MSAQMARKQKSTSSGSSDSRQRLLADLQSSIIGQDHAMEQIVPRVQMYRANLSPEGRPAGVFMLLGSTGVGKTETVEALAEVIHGSRKNVLRIDCGEFQGEHEVAKLIGAPPGYLGHRETQPAITQMKLNQVMSERANLAIVLFDEIEKAAPSMIRLLLGVLDKGVLRLGDNTIVQFERSLIFFTSNLGATEISRELTGGLGFKTGREEDDSNNRIDRLAMSAVRRKFSPEFINRIDSFITYNALTEENVRQILDLQLQGLADHITRRLSHQKFYLQVPRATRSWLIDKGYSKEYGARELKRCLDKHILQPLSDLIADGCVPPGAIVRISVGGKESAALTFKVLDEVESATSSHSL
jgi:ATP-dependent Clp protease ATP-binding subunit ClpA